MNSKRFREADLGCANLHYRLAAEKQFERIIPERDDETRMGFEREYVAALNTVEALRPETAAERILKSHMKDFLAGEKRNIRDYFENPASTVRLIGGKIESVFENDTRDDDEKSRILTKALKSVSRTETEASAEITNIRHYAGNIRMYMPNISESAEKELGEALTDTCALLEKGGLTPSKVKKTDEDDYRGTLWDTLGVSLDELLSWYETEMEKTRENLFETAARLPVSDSVKTVKEINMVLNRYAGACETPEEMFARMQVYLDRAQAAAHNAVNFPEEKCVLKGVPYPLRESFPWGGYSDGDGRLRPIQGTVFLNNYNFKAVTDGWLKMQALHEAYPGHHIQYVRRVADPLPETLKLGAKYIPLIEGTAHRTEHLFESVFDEDRFFPLFVAYRRHHTAVRIKSDLMLRYFGKDREDSVKLYMDELDFDRNTASGQVLAQENMKGYFTCYYYGLKKISDFEKKYAMKTRDFTECLFSCGNLSMENLEAYLQLSPEDRKSFENDYCSLLYEI